MSEGSKILADNLWEIIGNQGISIMLAAELWGISRSELSAILNCKKDVRLSTIECIAQGTEKSIADLISDKKQQGDRKNKARADIQLYLKKASLALENL